MQATTSFCGLHDILTACMQLFQIVHVSSASHSPPDQLVTWYLQETSCSLSWVVFQQDMLCYDLCTSVGPTQPAFASQPCNSRCTCLLSHLSFISMAYRLTRARLHTNNELAVSLSLSRRRPQPTVCVKRCMHAGGEGRQRVST